MAEVEYPATLEIEGPWLVERAALDELDEIIGQEFSRLVACNENELKKELQRKIEELRAHGLDAAKVEENAQDWEKWLRSIHPYRRECTVAIDVGGLTVKGRSVSEAAKHPALANATPKGLLTRFVVGETEGRLSIAGSWRTPSCRLDVSSSNADTRNSLFGAMRQWVEKAAPPKWQQFWYKVGAFPLWLGFGFLSFVAPTLIDAFSSVGGNPYRQEARDLLRHGLSPDKQTKAIELLLALASNYQPTKKEVPLPIWFYVFLLGGLLACLILSIGPKVIIGLGRGDNRIQLWRRWFRIIFLSIPMWAVSTAAASFFGRFL